MATPKRLGMPDKTDLAAQYRLHADKIANGEVVKPIRAVVIEWDAQGEPYSTAFGLECDGRQELISLLAHTMVALGSLVAEVNREDAQ